MKGQIFTLSRFDNILGFKTYTGALQSIKFKELRIINTINPHSYILSKKDILFKEALDNSDLLIIQ